MGRNSGLSIWIFLTAVVSVSYALNCYVCDTTEYDNDNIEICDDPFQENRGATVESGCAACVKEKAILSGVMFIRRSCEHALRWESSVWHCNRNEREWVLGVPGTKCVCTSDYCNGGPSLVKASTLLSTIVPIVLIIAHCLS